MAVVAVCVVGGGGGRACVLAYVRACVHTCACVRACVCARARVCVCVWEGRGCLLGQHWKYEDEIGWRSELVRNWMLTARQLHRVTSEWRGRARSTHTKVSASS